MAKMWTQTEIFWPMWDKHIHGNELPTQGKPTTIPIEGWDTYPNPYPVKLVSCTGIKARSRPSRNFLLSFDFCEENRHLGHYQTLGVKRRLSPIVQSLAGVFVAHTSSTAHNLPISVSLQASEQFCDQAIKVVKALVKEMGIDDPEGRLCGNFTIKQETFIYKEGVRTPYVEHLRVRHGLQPPRIYQWTN